MNNIVSSEGAAKTTMCALLLGAVLNIGLDPLFIYILDIGVEGAAIATAISQMVSTLVYLTYVLRKKAYLRSACKQGVCFVPVILLLPMVWGMNGILYAQPIADVISVVITVFMALHLHRELSMAEKQVMSNSEM